MQNPLPSKEDIIQLHKKYAPSEAAFDLVFTHCQIICDIAEQLMVTSNVAVNAELVVAGCLLHDIGVYRLYLPNGEIDHKDYIKHGTLGYELLKEEGFSEEICRFASCHTGVGLSEKEIIEGRLPIPPEDYFADTLEEQLVMYADKFHTKTSPPTFMRPDTYCNHIRKFGEAKVARFREFQEYFGTPDLTDIAATYGLEIV